MKLNEFKTSEKYKIFLKKYLEIICGEKVSIDNFPCKDIKSDITFRSDVDSNLSFRNRVKLGLSDIVLNEIRCSPMNIEDIPPLLPAKDVISKKLWSSYIIDSSFIEDLCGLINEGFQTDRLIHSKLIEKNDQTRIIKRLFFEKMSNVFKEMEEITLYLDSKEEKDDFIRLLNAEIYNRGLEQYSLFEM